MKRLLVATLLALSSTLVPLPAQAQMAGALGKPLESPDLPPGTVSVRVVAGSPSKNVIGTEVTLLVDGAPRVARTGNDGRAIFKDVKLDAQQLQAVVVTDDKREIKSDPFKLPVAGVKIMLSTIPWNASAAATTPGPMAGQQGMPNPRQMSGQPRPEQTDPPGTFTVRLSYDDFKDAPPVGVPVALVGYASNDLVDLQIVNSDPEGRAQFKNLDRTGSTSYFAMTLLPRDGKLERLMSTPAVLDARTGVRLILSAEKRTSGAPIVDDLTKYEKQDGGPPPGKVRVTLEGGPEANATVSLIEITQTTPTTPGAVANERRVFATGKPQAGPPDPTEIQASAQFSPVPGAAPNTLDVRVQGGMAGTNGPLEGVTLMVAPVATLAERRGQIDATTAADGTAKITIDSSQKGPFVAIITINGKSFSKQFELAGQGGTLDVEAQWASQGKPQVEFDVVPRPGQVFFAETQMHGQLFRSMPFQPIPERGTRVPIFVYPRVLFTFSLTSRVDDKYFGVNGRFEVINNAWAPYAGGPDGLLVPLPKGFTGGFIAEKDQGDIALMPGEGFRIIRPVAPGNRTFHGGFSIPVEDGAATWHLDLPFGAVNSGMEILQVPGMVVTPVGNIRGQTMTVPAGTYYVLSQISIMPKQAMVLNITGLPQPPQWKVWLPRIFGVLVLVMIIGGVLAAIFRARGRTDAERDARRQEILDELVELEQAGKTSKNSKRREQLMTELEKLLGDDDRDHWQPTA